MDTMLREMDIKVGFALWVKEGIKTLLVQNDGVGIPSMNFHFLFLITDDVLQSPIVNSICNYSI